MVDLDPLSADDEDELRSLILRHVEETESAMGTELLADWETSKGRFTKVMPQDFKRVLRLREEALAKGEDPVLAVMGGGNG
jgi:glutamate synthase (NADPH/NADH) large chain